MRLRTYFVVLVAAAFCLGMVQDGRTQEKKKKGRSKAPQVIEGAVYEVGKRTIQLDIGKRSRGRVAAEIIPVDPGQTKFMKVSVEQGSLADLTKGDVVLIKINEKGKYDPVVYIIQTGEKKQFDEGSKGRGGKK
ncbi:MAG TPA: hypothetical protein VGB25_01215, partial [Candidatus Binatia bacterium]